MRSSIWRGAKAAMAGVVLVAAGGQCIRIQMGEQSVTATLNHSEAARDLVEMLPMSGDI
jgi:hypothetical protein